MECQHIHLKITQYFVLLQASLLLKGVVTLVQSTEYVHLPSQFALPYLYKVCTTVAHKRLIVYVK